MNEITFTARVNQKSSFFRAPRAGLLSAEPAEPLVLRAPQVGPDAEVCAQVYSHLGPPARRGAGRSQLRRGGAIGGGAGPSEARWGGRREEKEGSRETGRRGEEKGG